MEFGEIENVELRNIWEDEARNFTPWLAENIDKLSKVLGLELDIVQTEYQVGSYFLDILAKDGEDDVIIENQLERTDHKHLGQIITYAAGVGAKFIIWVVASVTEEHTQAINWLNEGMSDKHFFLIRPSVIQIGDSKPALQFIVEAKPLEEIRTAKSITKGELAEWQRFNINFFDSMTEYLENQPEKWNPIKRGTAAAWRQFESTTLNARLCVAFNKREIRVELGPIKYDKDNCDEFLRIAKENSEYIDSVFDTPVTYYEKTDATYRKIYVKRPFDQPAISNVDIKNEIFNWVSTHMTLMQSINEKLYA